MPFYAQIGHPNGCGRRLLIFCQLLRSCTALPPSLPPSPLPPSLSLALSIDAAWRAGMDGDGGGQRGLEWLKNFDVFPKTVDDAKEVSVSGGSVSDANLI